MERVDALTREVRALREQIAPDGRPSLNDRIDALANDMHARTAYWRSAVAIGIVLVLGITGGALLLELRTRSEIADANRKLCPMVALLIPDPSTPARPVTPYTQELVRQARILYRAYGCPDTT